ncbi:hypothetical protein D9613_000001 [Agrocybe pediades]|uniref:Uncharacterized protein n=1 Tax=Agrocybe pediades TaxID=84607 RepID=A0A8H4R0T1_9AGAR|nr:hypothetical protein D9613_000001 [Agrocybe pediades]
MDPAILAYINNEIKAAEERTRSTYQQREAQLQSAWEQREAEATQGWFAQKAHLEREKAFLEERLRLLEDRLGDTHLSSPREPIIIQEPEQEEPTYEPLPATPQRKTRSKASLPSTTGTPPTARTTRKQASSNTSSPAPSRTTRSTLKATLGTPPAVTPPPAAPTTQRTPRKQKSGSGMDPEVSASATPPPTPARKSKPKQLLKKDIPPDALLLKEYMFTHARLISNAADAGDVLGDPDPEDKARFNAHFKKEEEVFKAENGKPLVPRSEVIVRPYQPLRPSQSRTLSRLANIESTLVEYIAATMSRVGIRRWAPDYSTGKPDSLWNVAMSVVFIKTFRQAVAAGAYDFNANQRWKQYMEDMDLLILIYDHIVWHHFFDKWREEQRSPGAAQVEKERQAMYAVKRKKANTCKAYCKKNKLHRLGRYLFDIKATSEDEHDPAESFIGKRPVYFPRRRPERSAEADTAIRLIRQAIDVAKDLTRNTKRPREDPILVARPISECNMTIFPAFPPNMPIDYYDPDFFNALPLELRKKADTSVLVLPGDASQVMNRRDPDAKLTGHQLMKKYGDSVLSRYDLDGFSSDEERESGEDEEDGSDFDDEEEGGDEEMTDEDEAMTSLDEEELREHREHILSSRRSALAAHLSVGNMMDMA